MTTSPPQSTKLLTIFIEVCRAESQDPQKAFTGGIDFDGTIMGASHSHERGGEEESFVFSFSEFSIEVVFENLGKRKEHPNASPKPPSLSGSRKLRVSPLSTPSSSPSAWSHPAQRKQKRSRNALPKCTRASGTTSMLLVDTIPSNIDVVSPGMMDDIMTAALPNGGSMDLMDVSERELEDIVLSPSPTPSDQARTCLTPTQGITLTEAVKVSPESVAKAPPAVSIVAEANQESVIIDPGNVPEESTEPTIATPHPAQGHIMGAQVTDQDCFLGREHRGSSRPGNVRFRNLIAQHKGQYQALDDTPRKLKTDLSRSVYEQFEGRFLKKIHDDLFYVYTETQGREKMRQALCDA